MKENTQIRIYPFAPRFLFLLCLMMLSFTNVNMMVHLVILLALWSYEKMVLPTSPFQTSFIRQAYRYIPFLIILFFFYAFFLQLGQHAILEIQVSGYTLALYAESMFYAFHYIFLFVELFWFAFLVLHEKKIDQIQYFFYGNLFSLTLIWNGTIQQTRQLFALKTEFDRAEIARGLKLPKVRRIRILFEYFLFHMLFQIQRQIPTFQRMWKQKAFYQASWVQHTIWFAPVLFILSAMIRQEISEIYYLKMLLLICLLGCIQIYYIIHTQFEKMSISPRWSLIHKELIFILIIWFGFHMYASVLTSMKNQPSFFAFPSPLLGDVVVIVFVLLVFRGESK